MRRMAGAATSGRPVGPATLWYWVAGAVVLAAFVWLALGLFLGLRSVNRQIEGFQRVPIPGRGEVSFAESGGYTLYFEGLGAADEHATIQSFNVSLTSVGTGEEIPIRPYDGSATYSLAGHAGRAVGTFRIEEPGRLRLQAGGEAQGVHANVAVGPSIGQAIFRMLVPTVPGTLILVFGGVTLAVVVAVRRNRARRPVPAPADPTVASDSALGGGPAGWFRDPAGRHELRYWDGQRWTEHVSDRQAQAVDPL